MSRAEPHVQSIRRAAGRWEVTRVRPLYNVDREWTWDYETLGRVVFEGGLYYCEHAVYRVDGEGIDFERRGRGWLLRERATRELTHPTPPRTTQGAA